MTLPTKPYCTSEQVAFLLPNLLNSKTDFDGVTTPKKTQVDQYINWISTQVELQFQQAGYVLPFTELDDESWPDHQTNYLELITSLGSAAMAGGHALKPAPALTPGRGSSSGNIFQDMYDLELKKIWESYEKASFIRFRCKTYSGTPAEKSIKNPVGPSLDYMVGKMNPEQFMLFDSYTQLKHNITSYMEDAYNADYVNWTDFHNLVSEKSTGYSYG